MTNIIESSALLMIQTMSKHPKYSDEKKQEKPSIKIPDLDHLEQRVYLFISKILKITEDLLTKRSDEQTI